MWVFCSFKGAECVSLLLKLTNLIDRFLITFCPMMGILVVRHQGKREIERLYRIQRTNGSYICSNYLRKRLGCWIACVSLNCVPWHCISWPCDFSPKQGHMKGLTWNFAMTNWIGFSPWLWSWQRRLRWRNERVMANLQQNFPSILGQKSQQQRFSKEFTIS